MAQLHFRCTSCHAALRALPGTAGRKVRCPRCGVATPVPAAAPEEGHPPAPSEQVPARPARRGPKESAAQAPPEAEDPVPPSPPKVRRKRRPRPAEEADDDPRHNRRNYPGWRKVRVGLLLLLIALLVPLAQTVLSFLSRTGEAMSFVRDPAAFSASPGGSHLGFNLSGLGLLLFGLQFLPSSGYFLCTFVPVSGGLKRWAIINFSLAVLLIASHAFTMLAQARASDPRQIQADMAKMQEQAQADAKAWQQGLNERLKGAKSPEAQQRAFDDLLKENKERATRETNRLLLRLRLAQLLALLLWGLQVVFLACFLRSVAHFFKAFDLDTSCLVLIGVTLLYVSLHIVGSQAVSYSWRPGESEERFLTPGSLNCFLLPFLLGCLLLQLRLLGRIRRVIDEFLP